MTTRSTIHLAGEVVVPLARGMYEGGGKEFLLKALNGLLVPCTLYDKSREVRVGDKVTISGPYGDFYIKDTGTEMLYVGGGAGMAPMRSHLFHLFHTLKTGRKVSYWYGGRSKRELFYVDQFRKIEKEFSNFKFQFCDEN